MVRGLAAILVVLTHINSWEGKYLGKHALTPSWFYFGYVGVDVFFVISGFIMVFIQPTPINSRPAYLRFIIHRLTRIYPPVWVVMLTLLPVWCRHPNWFNNFAGNHVNLLSSFLLLPQGYVPLLGVAWTLIHEVYFYWVVSFALLFAVKGRWIFGGLWFSIILATNCLWGDDGFGPNRFLQVAFSPFSLTFLLGYFIGLLRDPIRRAPLFLALLCLALGLGGMAYGVTIPWPTQIGVYPDNNHLFRFMACGLPAALLILSAIALERHLPEHLLNFDFLGDISYATYLIHLPFITGFYLLFSKLHWISPVAVAGAAVVCFTTCLLTSAAFHYYLEINLTRKCRQFLETIFHLRDSGRVAAAAQTFRKPSPPVDS